MTFDFRAVRLDQGDHRPGSSKLCLMEAVAYIAGEKHTDHPECVCPVIGAVGRATNDWMTQEERDELLSPMLFDFAGTRGTVEHEKARGYIAADYAVRVFAPSAMRADGLEAEAVKLESVPKIVDAATAKVGEEVAARAAASAARAAASAASAARAAASAASAARAAASAASAAWAAVSAASARAASAAWASTASTAASAAWAACGDSADSQRKSAEASCQMLRDMIAVHHDAPREWSRAPESLPCLVKGGAE